MTTYGRQKMLFRHRCGVSLAEVVVSTLLVGLLMTAALGSVGMATRSWIAAADGADATALARQLLDEIAALPYQDPNQTAVFGTESGEVPTAGARNFLDDIDDYNDWVDSPPKDRTGTPLAGYTGWSRTVDVQRVSTAGYNVVADTAADQELRLVTVSVTTSAGTVTTVVRFMTQSGGYLQPQGVSQTIISWVGVTLQAGSGTPVTGGTTLQNHAGDE